MVLWEVLGCWSVHARHDNVVTLVRLQGHLIHGAELLLAQDLHLVGVNHFGWQGGVDAGGLDGDDEVASVLDEHRGVEAENTGLIWLSHIGEDHVNHGHEHSVLLGVSGVLNNGDDICALLGHIDEVTADTLGELDGVDGALGADQVGHVGHGGARGSADVENLAARLHVDVVTTTADAGGELGAEGVPGSVLSLLSVFLWFTKNKNQVNSAIDS
jgi:hypothetical protein